MLDACTGQLLKIPVHASYLIILINVELKAKLYDPFHLMELVIVRPGGDREGPDFLGRGRRLSGDLAGEVLELDVKVFCLGS